MAKRKSIEAKFEQAYQAVIENYGKDNTIANENYHDPDIWVDETATPEDQVRAMVLLANEIQSEICNCADSIKIDTYEQVKELVGVSKGSWQNVVSLNAKKDKMRQKTRDKQIEKTKENIKSEMYKQIHLNVLNQDLDIAIPEGLVDTKVTETQDPAYTEILNESTKTRQYIDYALYPKYKELALAAEYITKGDVTYDRFKKMVDYEHYLGGYPGENTPARIDSTICSFLEAYYLLNKYKSHLFNEHFNDCVKIYGDMLSINHGTIDRVDREAVREAIKFDD